MNYLKYILSILFVAFSLNFTQAQTGDFHTSTTRVSYEVETGTLTITPRFFTSHIDKVVGESSEGRKIDDEKLKSYLYNNLSVKVNGKPISLTSFSSQTNDKSTRVYLKVDKITDISSLEMKVSFFTEIFDDQRNMVTVEIKNLRKTYVLTKGNDSIKITF